MRVSTLSFYALTGASAVSARTCGGGHVPVPLENTGNFTVISLDDAKAGILQSHNGSTSKIPDFPASGYPTPAYSQTSYPTKTGFPSGGSFPLNGTSTGKLPVGTGSLPSGSLPSGSRPTGSLPSGSLPTGSLPSGTKNSTSLSVSLSSRPTASATISRNGTSSTTSSAPVKSTSAAPTCGQRVEWRSYPDDQKKAFTAAIQCLMKKPASGKFAPATNRYEDVVRVHQTMVNSIHGNNVFLLWHRYYLWTFEQILKDECGFTGAFPWWDEALDAGHFAKSPLFTSQYFGSLPAATRGAGTCITDGAFANTVCNIGPGNNNQKHCLSRAVSESLTAQSSEDFVNTCNSRQTYPDMENCVEYGPHAYGHNGIGSLMADVSASPSDPAFFMHHLFIDRNYWRWQTEDNSRNTQINGCSDANSPCTPLTLNTVLSVQGLRPDVTVKDILDTQNGIACYSYNY